MKGKKREIVVIRLSERGYRDLRITTHCALVARAFGAQKIVLSEGLDNSIERNVQSIQKRFGGDFRVEYVKDTQMAVKEFKQAGWRIVHLTMYGEKPASAVKWLEKQKAEKVVVVIGSEKVPPVIYEMADRNVSVTRQPHSEVAALGVFLHYLQAGEEEKLTFPGGSVKINPNPRRKDVR